MPSPVLSSVLWMRIPESARLVIVSLLVLEFHSWLQLYAVAKDIGNFKCHIGSISFLADGHSTMLL